MKNELKEHGVFFLFILQTLRHLRGNGPLWSAFWLYVVLGKILFFGSIALFAVFARAVNSEALLRSPVLLGVFGFLYFLYFVGSLTMLWRCAPNVKHKPFMFLSRFFVVLVILSFVFFIVRSL